MRSRETLRNLTGRVLSGVLAAFVVATVGFDIAAQPVYRCDDGRGGVLYADAPCKGGVAVHVLPGKADSAAIERLHREQRAFDERQAIRDARARAEADALRETRRAQRERDAVQAQDVPYGGYPGYAWGGYWPWPPVPPRPPRPPDPSGTPSYVSAKPGPFLPSPPPGPPAARAR